jgi:hypothetical protein
MARFADGSPARAVAVLCVLLGGGGSGCAASARTSDAAPPANADGAARRDRVAPARVRCFWESPDSDQRDAASDPIADVERLAQVTDMPYVCSDLCAGGAGCGDATFWRVVRRGKRALHALQTRLDDRTPTKATIPNFGKKYTVADVAFLAMKEIVPELSGYDLMRIEVSEECGDCAWWRFVNGPKANRTNLKAAVEKWLTVHEQSLVWTKGSRIVGMDCLDRCDHPAGGHFELRSSRQTPSP